ncbi:MAG TPA: MBL fold metallo-hydrolase [Rhizomicrobium sp.]
MSLKVTILGCGSSTGVPRIGGPDDAGDWGSCDPTNPKNRRRRCSILVRHRSHAGATTILVDTSPDLREQLLDARCAHLDGVLVTHDHADQTHGFDDLRGVAFRMRRKVDVYSDRYCLDHLHQKFGYTFNTPAGSEYPPIAVAHEIEAGKPFEIGGAGDVVRVLPFLQDHGRIHSLGFRIGNFAYSPDVNGLPEDAFEALEGIDLWIVDALRYTPHPTHANVETALSWIARVKPRRAILTNLHMDLDYETLRCELPEKVEPAYDGMVLTLTA